MKTYEISYRNSICADEPVHTIYIDAESFDDADRIFNEQSREAGNRRVRINMIEHEKGEINS